MTARHGGNAEWRSWTIALSGMNARPDNPGAGLAVARCLREFEGFSGRLIGLGYEVLDPGLYDRALIDAAYMLPCPSEGGDGHLDRLLAIHAAESIDAIIPCQDAELSTFARNAAPLAAAGIRMLVPTEGQLKMRAKDHLAAFCAEFGISAPRTKLVSDAEFFDRCDTDGWSFPLVVKGLYHEAEIAQNAVEAKTAFYDIVMRWGFPVLLQQHVDGYEVNLAAVGDGNGGMIGPVMMRKCATTDKGKAWAGITIVDPELEELARTIIAATSWAGPLEVEALRGKDGTLYLIEVNPRFPAWIYLSHGVGRNLPAAQLALMADDTGNDLAPIRPGTLFIRRAQEQIVSIDEFRSLTVSGSL